MAGQARAEMTTEEAEALVAGALSGLPEVVSVHYEADGNDWLIMAAHDHGDVWDAVDRIVDKVADIEDRVPHLYLDPQPVDAADAGAHTHGMKEIYRRR